MYINSIKTSANSVIKKAHCNDSQNHSVSNVANIVANNNADVSKIFEYLTFNGNISKPHIRKFKPTKWDKAKAIFDEVQIIDNKAEYVNIVDFINNGKKSKLAQNIPILKACFNYRLPFKPKSENKTVGKHIQEVVSHLYYMNEEFKKLPEEDKKLLLKVAVFHDIGKVQNKIYKSDLNKSDFEEMIRQRIKTYEIFNKPADYIKNIRRFFENNPQETDMILHNNIHRKLSANLIKQYILRKPEHKPELDEIEILVLNHEDFGETIDKYKNHIIDKKTYNNNTKKFAKNVPDKRLLKLIKIFHLSDAYTVYNKNKPEYYEEFKKSLDEIYNKTLANLDD
ncbi:MAG: HD domain-containing protein [Candidatus Gastranaerophilales bacterium]|nr:HD domain-containing protein [Candidatus Gastranaerophilales bacterium]